VSVWSRVLAGSIVVLGLAVAIALPNGYVCRARDAVEVHRQWSFGQERWFYVCSPDRESIEGDAPFTGMPMGATTDWRLPLRIVVAIAGFVIAWVVVLVTRRGQLGAAGGSQGRRALTTDRRTRILVAVYALFGAIIAVLATLRQDDYWVRGTDEPSFPTRSFLGWDTTPVLAEALVAVVGAAGGALLALLVSNLHRRFESARAMAEARAGT
jgi:hypothetical protein